MSEANNFISLPDFWLTQIQFSMGRPLNHQLVCKHGKKKPHIHSKMKQIEAVPF